ncbi:MAG: hypothetical protein ACJAU1_000402 [Psychromonas sp.]|jgi:hypothetical protein
MQQNQSCLLTPSASQIHQTSKSWRSSNTYNQYVINMLGIKQKQCQIFNLFFISNLGFLFVFRLAPRVLNYFVIAPNKGGDIKANSAERIEAGMLKVRKA